MSSFNSLNKTTVDIWLGSFKHDTDTSLSIVSIDNTVFQYEIGRTPGTDRILSPRFALLIQAVEAIHLYIVRSCNLEALASRVRSSNIFGNHIFHLSSFAFLNRNTFRASFHTHIFYRQVFSIVSKDIVAIVAFERTSTWARHGATLVHSISDNFYILDRQPICIPEVNSSGVSRMMDHHILYRHIFVSYSQGCVIVWWRKYIKVLNYSVVTCRFLCTFNIFQPSTSLTINLKCRIYKISQ